MDAFSFHKYLIEIQKGYLYPRESVENITHYKSRTDDLFALNSPTELRLVCVGTEPKISEWMLNFWIHSVEWLDLGKVHSGFARNIHELIGREDQPYSLINECLSAAESGKDIMLLGHSRGYPISILIATQLISHGVSPLKIKVIGCGGAKVASRKFAAKYNQLLGNRTYVLNGSRDPVTFLPILRSTIGQVTKINLGGTFKHSLKHYLGWYDHR